MKNIIAFAVVMLIAAPHGAVAKLRVVSSSTNLASIAEIIGGDDVDVTSIAKGTADPHNVEVLPSYMIKVKRADIYLEVGLGLDLWAKQIIDGSRNSRLVIVNCSAGIPALKVPTGKVDASMGDVHPEGNPHYWLDPDNGVIIARGIAAAFIAADPKSEGKYNDGLQRFLTSLESHRARWNEKAAKIAGMKFISFHDTWPYFEDEFGVDIVAFVEPKPGIEPTPSHTAHLIELLNSMDVKVIGVEPYYSHRTPETIARATGATVVDLPPSVGGAQGADDYFSLFDVLLDRLSEAKGQ